MAPPPLFNSRPPPPPSSGSNQPQTNPIHHYQQPQQQQQQQLANQFRHQGNLLHQIHSQLPPNPMNMNLPPNHQQLLGQFPLGFLPHNNNNVINLSQLNHPFAINPTAAAAFFINNYINNNISNEGQQFLQMQRLGHMQMPNLPPLQVSNGMPPLNSAFLLNQQQQQQQMIGLMMHSNGVAQQDQQLLQGNASLQPQQPHRFTAPGNHRKDDTTNNVITNGKNSQRRNFPRHPKHEVSHGFKKPKGRIQNTKGKFNFDNSLGGKDHKSEGATQFAFANPGNETQLEKKKSLSLHYTEQEIQQWRNARKKNFPSKTNLEKKLIEKIGKPEFTDMDAELRRQQLKEVLTKQAELGCEVAEIPSHYLFDSEKQMHDGMEEDKQAFSKKGRLRNKFNKRGRRLENNRFTKKQRPSETNSSILVDQSNTLDQTRSMRNQDLSTGPIITKKREPTLLQKLLSADLKKDRGRLLQVFKFMVMNSFFKDGPSHPLVFPSIILKETEGEGELVNEKSPFMTEVRFEQKGSTKNLNNNDNNEDDITANQLNETGNESKEAGSTWKGIKGVVEEEGEIID